MFSWTLLLQHVYHLTYSIKPQPYQSLPKVLNFNKIHQLKLSRSDIFLVIHQLKHRYNGKHSQGQPTHSTFISTILLSMTEIKKMPSRISPPHTHCPTLIIKYYRCNLSQNAKGLCIFAKNNYFLCFQILNPVWSCQWGLMEALDRRIPIWLADG